MQWTQDEAHARSGAMNVLFLTSTLPRFPGDMQAGFVLEQAQAWLAARPDDKICIFAPHDAGIARAEQLDGIAVRRFCYFLPVRWQKLAYPAMMPNIRRNPVLALQVPFFLLGQYLAAKKLVREMKPDLVYAHWVMPQGLVAWRLKRRLGVPYVLQNHSSDLSVFLKLGRLGRAVARAILRDAAHFFCVNAAQREFALDLFDISEREEFAKRVTVLPMGIAGVPDTVHGEGSGYDIATIARLSKKKGLNYLIEAAEDLAKRGIRPRIGIAGDGEDRAELEAMVEHADITFPGFLVGAEKERFLAETRRFAFPSRAHKGDVEGLPVALLEALCCGRPVLASKDTNVEMLTEWPDLRDAVIFVEDPADLDELENGLERLLNFDPSKAAKIAAVVGRYRWESLIEEYLSPIESKITKSPPR